MLSGADGSVTRMREGIKQMQVERAFLMTENGFKPDYTDMAYACENCRDTGVRDDGARCACFEQRLAEVRAEERPAGEQ